MNYLIYINGMGPNYKGDNIYEFIFSETLDVWGENWESKPSNGYPSPPDFEYIKNKSTESHMLKVYSNDSLQAQTKNH